MIFRPDDVNTRLWDTFILPHDNQFFLFYLQYRKDYWDGYGMAVSDDLLHWHDYGTILDTGPASGSGVVYRVGEQWILSFCKLSPQGSHIKFAKSKDLYTWDILPDEYNFYPDPRWYDAAFPGRTSSRFDSLMWVERKQDGSYFGLFTGSLIDGPAGANGVIATALSRDGLHWEAGPPASECCGMGWAEFTDHVEFSGRHYALVGNTGGFGKRIDSIYNPTGKCGGMYVMASDRVNGPYSLVEGDPLLLGCRNAPANWAYVPAYSISTFQWNGETLANHHWMPRLDFTDAWLGTCKTLVERRPGQLALQWWRGNENLKGRLVLDIINSPRFITPKSYELPTGVCEVTDHGVSLRTESTALTYCSTESLCKGIFLEAVLRIYGKGAGGLFFGSSELTPENPYEGSAILFNTAGWVEFGAVRYWVCSPTFTPENQVKWPIRQNEDIRLRLLIKREFIEAYIDDILVQGYGFSRPVSQHIGIFAECDRVDLCSLKVYEFNL